MNFSSWAANIQQRIEVALELALPSPHISPTRLHDAMRYAVLGGGKRVRPLLCHAAGDLFKATSHSLDTAAIATNSFTHIHLCTMTCPALTDNDILRRGKPTCHIEFDEVTALLAGDALQTLAFQVLSSRSLDIDLSHQLDMLNLGDCFGITRNGWRSST